MRQKRRRGKRRSPIQRLRARLDEAEATLEAIRTGKVDAVVVSGPGGEQTLAIEGATHPYHVLLNAMSDGTALLESDGTILFGNRRLGEIARAPLEGLRGSRFQQLVAPAERPSFEGFLRDGTERHGAREFAMVGGDAAATPVWIALSTVPLGAYRGENGATPRNDETVLMAIITDLTDRKRAEVTRLGLMTRLLSAEDDERRRLARELHDETGQPLTALLLGLRTIQDVRAIGEARSVAERLRTVVARTMDNVGRLARGLHPRELDEWGLATAAARYVRGYTRSLGIVVDFRRKGLDARRLPPLIETTMYRILQEALTNVARHARVQRAAVELKREGATLELVVRDNGVGFDMSRVLDEASGLGLHNMHERITLLGGSIQIDSRPGQGTAVRARIPVGAAAAAAPQPHRSRHRRGPPG